MARVHGLVSLARLSQSPWSPEERKHKMPQLGHKYPIEIQQQIAARAYEKWRLRGCPQGDNSGSKRDWCDASAEVEAELERRAYEREIAIFD